MGAPRPPAPSQTKEAAVTVRGSEPEPPEGGWDSADTVTSFPDPNALPEPSRDMPQVNVREVGPVSTTSPSFTAPTATSPTRERTAAQAMAAAQPPPQQQQAPLTQAQPSAQAATQKIGPAGSASLAASMREEVWAIVRAAVNEATAPLIARNRELEARIDRAEKEIIARTTGAARGNTAPMQATPAPPQAAPAGGSAASRLATIGSNSIPIAVSASVAPPQVSPGAPPAPRIDTAPASVTRPEFRIDAPMVLPGPRASIPPQGLGVAVMTVQRPSLDLESVGAVDVSEFDGGRKKRMVARVFVVVMLAIVTGCVVAMIVSRS